jgi:hypothetical protein
MTHMTVEFPAESTTVTVLAPGDETGDIDRITHEQEVMAPGQYAVCLSADAVGLVTGTRAELLEWLEEVASALA